MHSDFSVWREAFKTEAKEALDAKGIDSTFIKPLEPEPTLETSQTAEQISFSLASKEPKGHGDRIYLRELYPGEIASRLDGSELQVFLLRILEDALDDFLKKLQPFFQIEHEDFYSHFICAIINSRIRTFGWKADEQSLSGRSGSTKEIAEYKRRMNSVDIRITSSQGHDIVLVEALRFNKYPNGADVSNHIERAQRASYNTSNFGFILIYTYSDNFEDAWQRYVESVNEFDCQTFKMLTGSFHELDTKTPGKSIRVGQATHTDSGSDFQVYHILTNVFPDYEANLNPKRYYEQSRHLYF